MTSVGGRAVALRRRIAVAPADAEAHFLVAAASPSHLEGYGRAAIIGPDLAPAWSNWGTFLRSRGLLRDALRAYRRAFVLYPSAAEILVNLADAVQSGGRPTAAEVPIRRALAANPLHPTALRVDGLVRHGRDRLLAATIRFRQALCLAPDVAQMHLDLGNARQDQGEPVTAERFYLRALAIVPRYAEAYSNMLFSLCFREDIGPEELFRRHRGFDRIFGHPAGVVRHRPDPRAVDRPLVVGYVSPDFRRHPGGYFLLPPIEHHDSARCRVICYSGTTLVDDFTDRFRKAADLWRDITGVDDGGAEAMIRADGVDILVECAGHMAGNRLSLFARRPAPVQIGFPLYPATSGLSAIDYRIMDRHFAPEGAEAWHSERIIRLETHVCYEPGDRLIKPASEPPCFTRGYVTFGSFNNLAKLGPATLRAWARILQAVPDARLRLKWSGLRPDEADWVYRRFADCDIGRDRLWLSGFAPEPYRPYFDLDIALDPLVANGGTTTCDALWMGVPVVTCAGRNPFSRVGLGHLTTVGLPRLVAPDPDAYVALAVRLARNPSELAELRHGLRERFACSALMDGSRYARGLEAEYHKIWEAWCHGELR